MGVCKGIRKDGKDCSNVSMEGHKYCWCHKEQGINQDIALTGLGAVIGHLLMPGIGGILLGGGTAYVSNRLLIGDQMVKKRVFVSFDFDEDRRLKEFIIQQAKNSDSPFSVIDHSLKEAAPERSWKDKARSAIKRSEIVLVMVGPNTYKAPGVLAEVSMAREEGKPIVQVIGYKDGNYTAVPNAGRLYHWNWDNLKKLLG